MGLPRTDLCSRLGIELPIVQAPIGSATTPALAAAVAEAGGVGMLALSWRSPDEIRVLLREVRSLTGRPVGVNLVLAWPQHERLRVCLEEGIRIFSFSWGDPRGYVDEVQAAGGVAMVSVGSASEAVAAGSADVLVAQGWEAGGHVLGSVATLPLVPVVVDAAAGRPVVAAGGIGDGRGLAAALTLGAAGAMLGTRFLASREADVHGEYQRALLEASEADTVYTRLFDGGWPDAPHRTLRNSTVRAAEAAVTTGGRRPGVGDRLARTAAGRAIQRFSFAMPTRGVSGGVEALALYAGQSVGAVREVQPAAEIVRSIAAEASAVLRDLARGGATVPRHRIARREDAAEIPEVVEIYVEAFTSSDLERCLATFARDGTYSDPGTPEPLAREQLEDYLRGVFARYPEAAWETIALDAISEDICVWRWILRVPHPGSSGAPPVPERRLTLAGCEFITVRGGKIHRVEGYFDRLGVLEQRGLSPGSQSY